MAPLVVFVECTSEAHDEAKKSPSWWAAQEQKGIQKFDGRPFLSLVNCRKCGSTLAKRIEEADAPDVDQLAANETSAYLQGKAVRS